MSSEGYKYEPCPICGKQEFLSMDTMSNKPYMWIRCLGRHYNDDAYFGPTAITPELAIHLWDSESHLRFNGIPREHLRKEEL